MSVLQSCYKIKHEDPVSTFLFGGGGKRASGVEKPHVCRLLTTASVVRLCFVTVLEIREVHHADDSLFSVYDVPQIAVDTTIMIFGMAQELLGVVVRSLHALPEVGAVFHRDVQKTSLTAEEPRRRMVDHVTT